MSVRHAVGSFGCSVLLLTSLMTFWSADVWAQAKTSARLLIDHKGYTQPQRRGSPLVIEATITAPAGVRKAEVMCRPVEAREFAALPMVDQGENVYRAIIPDWMTASRGLEYYITATDQLGHSTSHGFVGFPLVVRLVAEREPTQEERLKTLQDALDIIRKSRETQGTGGYNDPLQHRYR